MSQTKYESLVYTLQFQRRRFLKFPLYILYKMSDPGGRVFWPMNMIWTIKALGHTVSETKIFLKFPL